MAVETERKYLVTKTSWRKAATNQVRMRQGYLAQNERVEVRVRIESTGSATLTVKTSGGGLERAEFEFEASAEDADALLRQCGGHLIDKVRYTVPAYGRHWLVDEYAGALAGLVVAEIELANADDRPERLPDWLGAEITGDPKYSNARLAAHGLPSSGNHP